MFHNLDANKPQSLFKYLPILSFTESYFYQVKSSVIWKLWLSLLLILPNLCSLRMIIYLISDMCVGRRKVNLFSQLFSGYNTCLISSHHVISSMIFLSSFVLVTQLDCINEQILNESVGSHTVPKKEHVITQMSDGIMSSSSLLKCERKSLITGSKMVSGTLCFPYLLLWPIYMKNVSKEKQSCREHAWIYKSLQKTGASFPTTWAVYREVWYTSLRLYLMCLSHAS